MPPPPPSLSKHGQGQKNNGHTGSSCLDKPVLACNVQHKKTLHTENPPVPHTKHNSHTRTRTEETATLVGFLFLGTKLSSTISSMKMREQQEMKIAHEKDSD